MIWEMLAAGIFIMLVMLFAQTTIGKLIYGLLIFVIIGYIAFGLLDFNFRIFVILAILIALIMFGSPREEEEDKRYDS